MLSGRTVWLPVISGHRTKEKDCTSWPTPQTFDASNEGQPRPMRYKGNAPSEAGNTRNPDTIGSYRGDLKDYAALASWPSPIANNYEQQDQEALQRRRQECKERTGNGNGFGMTLGNAARMATRSAPRAHDLTGWPTPNHANGGKAGFADDAKLRKRLEAGHQQNLQEIVKLIHHQVLQTASGSMPNGFGAETKSTGQLNPEHSRWLIGLPIVWGCCAAMVTPLSRRSRKSLSKRTSK